MSPLLTHCEPMDKIYLDNHPLAGLRQDQLKFFGSQRQWIGLHAAGGLGFGDDGCKIGGLDAIGR